MLQVASILAKVNLGNLEMRLESNKSNKNQLNEYVGSREGYGGWDTT